MIDYNWKEKENKQRNKCAGVSSSVAKGEKRKTDS